MYKDTSSKPNQTYLDDLATKVDENNEPNNKGYAFAIGTSAENVPSDGKTGYQEKITWKLWDYTKRARGPKQDAIYTVQMKNYNLGADWKTVATYTNDGTVTINDPDEYETTITQQGNGIVIAPNGLSNNNSAIHNGLLKVLRDYKHYAQVIVTRVNSEGQEITASFADDEEKMYAYREITNAELAKATMLAISYAFYINDGGNSDYSNINNQFKYGGEGTVVGGKGSATFSSRSRATFEFGAGKFKHTYSFNEYAPSMLTQSNTSNSFLKLSSSATYTCGIKGDIDSYVYKFKDAQEFKVNYANTEPNLSLNTAIVTFEAPDNNTLKLSVERNETTTTIVNTSDNDTRKRWFPMQIHGDKKYLLKDATYGWW